MRAVQYQMGAGVAPPANPRRRKQHTGAPWISGRMVPCQASYHPLPLPHRSTPPRGPQLGARKREVVVVGGGGSTLGR
jgi:hypothetical protein